MLKIIKEVNKKELKEFLYSVDLNDEKLYSEVNSANVLGIFQFTGNTANRLLNDIKPDNFEELVAINALARPGSISMLPSYLDGKEGKPSQYPKELEPIFGKTKNTILFQEQIMKTFSDIGGFSLEEADNIRGLMKKLGKKEKKQEDLDAWDRAVEKFTKGAQKNGISPVVAKKLAADMADFSAYSFNRSHAVAYTYVAIMTIYLSHYFRKYFYSAILDYEIDNGGDIITTLNKVKMMGYEILPPDVNKSYKYMYPIEDKKILYGLMNIKYIGEKPIAKIIENRPYKSLIDFILKTRSREVSSKVIKALISVGAFDWYDENRKKLLWIFEKFWKDKKSIKVEEKLLFIWNRVEKESNRVLGLFTSITDLRTYEREFLGFNFFTSVFSKDLIKAFVEMNKKHLIYLDFDDVDKISKKVPMSINSIRTLIDRNGNQMAFMEGEDILGNKISIPVFGSYWKHIKDEIEEDNIYLMNVHRDEKGNILFGQKGWGVSEFKIKRMIKKIQ